MKKSLISKLQTSPEDYIIVNGEAFSLYLSADLEGVLKDCPAEERESYTFRMLDTDEVRTAFVYGVGKISKAHRGRFPDTATFLGSTPPTPKHGEKTPQFVKKSDARKRCKCDHAMDMDTFYRTWKDRVRAAIKNFGVRDSSLIDDLEQNVYVRMIKFRVIEECICALPSPVGASFTTHVFGVIRTVCLNHLRDNGRTKECSRCAIHGGCLTPGFCEKCKSCSPARPNSMCRVCKACNHCPDCVGHKPAKAPACLTCDDSYQFTLCKQCKNRKVCVDCRVCRACRDERERPVRNVLSQAEPLFFTGNDGEEFLHPEVSKLCDNGDVVSSPLERFLTLLQAELEQTKPWRDHRGTIKSLTAVNALFYLGYESKEIAARFQSSRGAVAIWRARIKRLAEQVCAKHNIDLESLYYSTPGQWESRRTLERLHEIEDLSRGR